MENIEDSLIDEHELLTLKCPLGHIFQMSFYDFEKGKRCPTCEEIK